MSVTRIAQRYAKSLIDLAVEQQKLERITGDVQAFQSATKNRDFYLLLKSPIVHADKKGNILKALFGGKFDELTMSFLQILLIKGREAYLPEIAAEYMAQYKAIQHITTVKVTSAAPLSKEAIEEIKAKVIASGATEPNLEIVTAVDPSLIGGYVLEFGDRLYNDSVAYKLNNLKKSFSSRNMYVSEVVKR